jgi:hypothetical protein
MNTRYLTAAQSPAEQRPKKPDFKCACGNEWNAPGHIYWAPKMYCTECGEIVEAQ